ncbi:MAG: stalk domain-containing protein [Caldisericaceae bacterium]
MEIEKFRKGIANIATALIIAGIILSTLAVTPFLQNDPNPSSTVIRAYLKEMALKYNIPSVVLMGIAYTESGWRQFDSSGNPIINYNSQTSFDIGIMQINSVGRSDIDKLKSDIFYNIEVGAKILDGKWKITPGIGDRDRNVLENWYYAIWAYNGFSYTNHPLNTTGRHYQDKVIDNIGRFILGNDGQPLWSPTTITKPDPATIANPPQWIPTPIPYHYGDLYSNSTSSDNARLLAGPSNSVIKTNRDTMISYLMQNVGTTVWKKNSGTFAKLTLTKNNSVLEYTSAVSKDVVQGESYQFSFVINAPSSGIYSTQISMYNGTSSFGSNVTGTIELLDVQVSDGAQSFDNGFDIGQRVPLKFNFSLHSPLNSFVRITLQDSYGNTTYASLVNTGTVQQNIDNSFVPLSQLLIPGSYTLKEELIFVDGQFNISENTPFPSYCDFAKPFIINNMSQTGIMVDSSPEGAHILINGSDSGFITPAFVKAPPALYNVTLTKDGFLNQQVSTNLVSNIGFVYSALQVDSSNFSMSLVPNIVNLAPINSGDSSFATLSANFDGTVSSPITITSDSKWLSVYPYSFNTAAAINVFVDSRWVTNSGIIQGKLTFSNNSKSYTVAITANIINSSAQIYFQPSRATPREGDTLAIDVHISSPKYPLQKTHFDVSYDPSFLSYIDFAQDEQYAVTSDNTDGSIDFDIANLNGLTGDSKVISINFKALKQIGSGTLIKMTNATAISMDNKQVSLQTGTSIISILPKLTLPSQVSGLTAEPLIGKIQLNFSPSQQGSYPIKEYEIYRSKDDSLDNALYIGSTQNNSFIDNGPLERVPYFYWILAVDSYNNSSIPSASVEAIPLVFSDSLPKNVKLVFVIGKPYVYINGIQMPMEVAPFIKAGRTFVPVRYVAQPFGAQVIWNSKTQQVTLIHKKVIELWINNSKALVDGIETPIDAGDPTIVPFIQSGRTMLPLRFVAENFGCDVQWDAKTQTITIDYQN